MNVVAKEARRRVRRKTGKLRKAIKVIVERRRKGASERLALLGIQQPESKRAHFEEFGTSRQSAHPFIRPAMDSKAKEALDAMGKRLAKGINDEAMKLRKGKR
jgi:HK97 gp10 family phage protein